MEISQNHWVIFEDIKTKQKILEQLSQFLLPPCT